MHTTLKIDSSLRLPPNTVTPRTILKIINRNVSPPIRLASHAFTDQIGATVTVDLGELGGGVVDGVLRAAAVAPDGTTVALAIELPAGELTPA